MMGNDKPITIQIQIETGEWVDYLTVHNYINGLTASSLARMLADSQGQTEGHVTTYGDMAQIKWRTNEK